jgi:hypothetical protein
MMALPIQFDEAFRIPRSMGPSSIEKRLILLAFSVSRRRLSLSHAGLDALFPVSLRSSLSMASAASLPGGKRF